MTEERIKELAEEYWPVFDFHVAQRTIRGLHGHLKILIRTVAAEAREEGIKEAVEIALPCLIESENIKKVFTLEIERLKEKP